MSRWIDGKIERFEPKVIEGYPRWVAIDCGCCNGICWGGSEPMECDDCGASGWLVVHADSGVKAWYPGGPLAGKADPSDVALALATAGPKIQQQQEETSGNQEEQDPLSV